MSEVESVGWIGKRWKKAGAKRLCNYFTVYHAKGVKDEWNDEDWPPVKVIVAIAKEPTCEQR